MSREIVAIDFDDVVSSHVDALIEFSNARYGTSWTRDSFQEPDEYWGYFERKWGVGDAEGERRFSEFLAEGYPLRQTIEPATLATLSVLQTRRDLVILTARGEEFRVGTQDLVERLAPSLFKATHFVHQWDRPDSKATKARICQEIGADYLIDDNVEHCNIAAEAGVNALLFGQLGWQVGQRLNANVVRCSDWRAVETYFDERS